MRYSTTNNFTYLLGVQLWSNNIAAQWVWSENIVSLLAHPRLTDVISKVLDIELHLLNGIFASVILNNLL